VASYLLPVAAGAATLALAFVCWRRGERRGLVLCLLAPTALEATPPRGAAKAQRTRELVDAAVAGVVERVMDRAPSWAGQGPPRAQVDRRPRQALAEEPMERG
jgi:hypothetical protein